MLQLVSAVNALIKKNIKVLTKFNFSEKIYNRTCNQVIQSGQLNGKVELLEYNFSKYIWLKKCGFYKL